jgi:hypothetical protein
MQKKFLIPVIVFLVSCGNKLKPDLPKTNDSTTTAQTDESIKYNPDSLLGDYIGGFGKSTIILTINYINGKIASGYDVIKGNRRNIKGKVSDKGSYFEFELSEPGGDENDGMFKFKIDTSSRTMEGTWTPNDTAKLKTRQFKLAKRKYQHDEIDGIVGSWSLNDLTVEFKSNKTGVAKGPWRNENYEILEQANIPFSWFEEGNTISIEWSKNNIFPASKMKFKYEKVVYGSDEYEISLRSDGFIMYRY